jgi:hypothetical protein
MHRTIGGNDLPEPWLSSPWSREEDWPLDSAAEDSVAELVLLYQAPCERSQSVIAALDSLDAIAALPAFGQQRRVNARWALVHMVDETAWHLGHLDVLRDALGLPTRDSGGTLQAMAGVWWRDISTAAAIVVKLIAR